MTVDTTTTEQILDRAFSTADAKLRRLVTEHPGRVPTHTAGGRWHLDADEWAPTWTAGFFTGMLWLLSKHTGDPWWREQAERYSRDLAHRRLDTGTHDIGFIFTPSWGRWRQVDDTDEVRGVLADAGQTMAARFNPNGRYLSTWVDPGSTFIDVMMNIDIIYEAAEITGNAALSDIATAHALTSRRHLLRGDATTIHEGWFDPESGEFLRSATHQGWRADSSWVRGHTWAMYGFGSAYVRTGDRRFLDTAVQLADGYIDRSNGQLPPNDWEDPAPEFPTEASAAGIAAAGLAQLADLCGTNGGDRYRDHAIRLVTLLSGPEYLAYDNDGWEGLIRHATYHRGNNLGVDESVMWGDYYYLEAVDRLFSSKGR
jgi:unsaturated chondroitin disaccharide hydrolase